MRYLVQRPLPDELLSSVWVRSTRRAGLPIGTVTRELTNGRKWMPSFFNVGHLADLAPLMGSTPMTLLWQHTVFPYATAFFEPDIFDKAQSAALSIGAAAIGMGAVTQSVSDHARFRRFCPECAHEEKKRLGESYWHRSQNLPGVLVCLAHERSLVETQLQTSGRRSWSYALPHELKGERLLYRRANAFELELARRSVTMLGRTQAEPLGQIGRSPNWYREALLEQGLLSKNRQVSVQKLVAWAQSAIGGKVTRLGFIEKDADLAWLGQMVRPRISIPFVPLKHLIFETLLALQRVTWAAKAIEAMAAMDESTSLDKTTPNKVLRALDYVSSGLSGPPIHLIEARDKQYAAALTDVIRGYQRRGKRVRVCDALTEAGCWSEFRHNRTNFPRVSAVVLRLRMSWVSARQIKNETNSGCRQTTDFQAHR